MSKRKSLSKRIRFEVFKRDSFTCQYCGAKSPEVILEVDHITPVSKGGDNDILNLVTACKGCNGGKSNRELDDHAELSKQRAQLEELNQRREQLEQMLQWREELKGFDAEVLDAIVDAWNVGFFPNELNEVGVAGVKKIAPQVWARDSLRGDRQIRRDIRQARRIWRDYREFQPRFLKTWRYLLQPPKPAVKIPLTGFLYSRHSSEPLRLCE